MTIIMTMVMRAPTRTVKAGEFKAKCLELMDRVAETGESILITKRGRPVARLVSAEAPPPSLFGFAKGSIEILGDIISPVMPEWQLDEAEIARVTERAPSRTKSKRRARRTTR